MKNILLLSFHNSIKIKFQLLLLALVCSLASYSQCYPTGMTNISTNGEIHDIEIDSSTNSLFIGGKFSLVNYVTSRSVLFDPTSNRFQPIEKFLETSFTNVHQIIEDGMGGCFVTGTFTTNQDSIFMLHLDSNLIVNQYTPTRKGLNARFSASCYHSGKIYIASDSVTIDGQAKSSVVSIDWDNNIVTDLSINANGWIDRISANGSIVVIQGNFNEVDGISSPYYYAKDVVADTILPYCPIPNNYILLGMELEKDTIYLTSRAESNLGEEFFMTGKYNVRTGMTYWEIRDTIYNFGGYTYNFILSDDKMYRTVHRAVEEVNLSDGQIKFIAGIHYADKLLLDNNTLYVSTAPPFSDSSSLKSIDLKSYKVTNHRIGAFRCCTNSSSNHSISFLKIKNGLMIYGGAIGYVRNNFARLNLTTGVVEDEICDADGPVYAIARKDSTLYIGGDFDSVGTVAQTDIVAVTSPYLKPISWKINGAHDNYNNYVHHLVLSGDTLFCQGKFSKIVDPWNDAFLIGVDIKKNSLLDFKLTSYPLHVYTVKASAKYLYIGGSHLGYFQGQQRDCIARFDLKTLNLDPWNPNIGRSQSLRLEVKDLSFNDSLVAIVGTFDHVNGQVRQNVVVLNENDGSLHPFKFTKKNIDLPGTGVTLYGANIVIAGPVFDFLDGSFSKRITAFNLSSNSFLWDTDMGYSANDYVSTLTHYQNRLFAGGIYDHTDIVGRAYSNLNVFSIENAGIKPTINFQNNKLIVNETFDSYQWADCSVTPPRLILGETSNSFTPLIDGSYSVVGRFQNCSSISDCAQMIVTKSESINKVNVNVYPNPTSGVVTIASSREILSVKIFNQEGALLKYVNGIGSNEIEISIQHSGLIFIEVCSERECVTKKVVAIH